MGEYPQEATAQTEAACKMRAVQRFQEMRNTLWTERDEYARCLGLKRDRLGRSTDRPSRYQTVNLSFRYMQGLTAEVTGEPLHLKMSRDAGAGQAPVGSTTNLLASLLPMMLAAAGVGGGMQPPGAGPVPGAPPMGAGQPPGGPAPMGMPGAGLAPMEPPVVGDEEIAEWVERAVSRVLYEAGFQSECDSGVSSACAYGVTGWWIGFHDEVVGLDEAVEVSKDVSGDPDPDFDPSTPPEPGVSNDVPSILKEAMDGDAEAKPGQPHREAADTLRDAAKAVPLTRLDTMQALHARAQSHDRMAEKEGKAKVGETREIQRRIWIQRGSIGLNTFWHPGRHTHGDMPWYCQRVLVPLESFRRCEEYAPEYRKAAKGIADPFRPSVDSKGDTPSSEQVRDANDPYDKYVECYVFWLREPWRTDGGRRKIACPEFPGKWIETDERNPYVDKKGRQLISGFFPFFPCVPIVPPIDEAESTFGTALIEPGYATQTRIDEFLSTILSHYKRHGFRVYALHPLMKGKRGIQEALRKGQDGFSFIAPEGISDAKDMQNLIVPIQFSGQAEQMERMLSKLIEFWRIEQGVPAAVLLGQAMADTATQEEIGVSSGQNEMAVIAGRFEDSVAEMCRGVLGLMRGFYKTEKMREMLGADGAKAWDAYLKTSTVGDRLEVMLGRRAKQEKAVDRKQLVDAIGVVRTTVDPMTMMRTMDETPQVDSLLRSLGQGKAKRIPPDQMLIQQFVQNLMSENASLKGAAGKPGDGGNKPDGGGGKSSDGPPNNENLNAGARNGTAAAAA